MTRLPGRVTRPHRRRSLEGMSLSQPSRTIVVEPVDTSTTSPRAAQPPSEPPRHVVEAASVANPPVQTPART